MQSADRKKTHAPIARHYEYPNVTKAIPEKKHTTHATGRFGGALEGCVWVLSVERAPGIEPENQHPEIPISTPPIVAANAFLKAQ
jgi:hypothetical protein